MTNLDEEVVFNAARRIEASEARRLYVEQACGPDRDLRARIEALLRVHDQERSFLEPPTQWLPAGAGGAVREGPGTVIGPYQLLEQIGEGGFGVVFRAEQQQPLRRQVALKVIKPGMDTRQVVARFEAERQALALMAHPNIAQVLDGGATASGRPYFVMELVKGLPVTAFCDQNQLSIRQRLELFVGVCQAVQHAHQKGIIHRDLKPSNVLVALYDGKPVPKVIDFGIAKALGQRLTDKTLLTHAAQLVGTPLYMSPEQAALGGLDVDTRTDIYTLGVLLYELLTGTTPFEPARLRAVSFDEVRRIIREEEPARPSARLTTLGDAALTATADRQSDLARLSRLCRGELDWIVMKCLEKDRARRYDTADGLARDIQRYLNEEPVEASPPSTTYRVKKFLRRHRGPALAAALLLLLLVAGVVGTTIGLVLAERAKETAEKRLDQIEKGIDLLGSLFEDLDPWAEEKEGRPLRAILGDRLDEAAAHLEGAAVGDPLVVARLQDRLGQTYLALGHAARAEALFTKAHATRQVKLGADDPLTLATATRLAGTYLDLGKRIEAIALFEQVWNDQVKVLGAHHLDTLTTQHNLGWAYRVAGRPAEAVALLEQVRDERLKQLGPDHDQTLATLQQLAGAYMTAEKRTEAVNLLRQVLDVRVQKHGADHPHAIAALNSLAYAYQYAFKMPEALALFKQARDASLLRLGPYHPLTLTILRNLGHMYRAYRWTPEAIALLEDVRERMLLILGDSHPATLATLNQLAMAHEDAGDSDKALPLFQQAAVGVERLQFVHGDAGLIIHNLCKCHERLNQFDEAEVWRRKWLAVVKQKDGPESAAYAGELARRGANLLQQNKHADAEPVLRECLAIFHKGQSDTWAADHARSLLGAALLGQRRYAEAEPLLVQGYRGMKKAEQERRPKHHGPPTGPRLTEALERLVRLYDAWGKEAEAAQWRKELDTEKARAKR